MATPFSNLFAEVRDQGSDLSSGCRRRDRLRDRCIPSDILDRSLQHKSSRS